MKDPELVAALRRLKINTKGIACLGCNYERDCGVHGCRLIGCAADRIAESDAGYGPLPKIPRKVSPPVYVHDFELCRNPQDLMRVLKNINNRGYIVVSVTQDSADVYTIFFRRPVHE